MPDSRISLDGTWEFLHISDDRLAGPAEVREIVVPAPWQAQFADLRMRAGIGLRPPAPRTRKPWLKSPERYRRSRTRNCGPRWRGSAR